jgi:hypothetical protein
LKKILLKKTLFKLLFTNYADLTFVCIAKQERTLMHAKISYIQHFILLATFCALTACSDSSTPESAPTPLTEEAFFPFIQNNTLYNFNPDTGSKEKLAESNKSLMIGLDIDQSEQITITDDDTTTTQLNQTTLPEYVVYVEDQTLRLYDLHTRYDHLLTNFTATSEQNDGAFICDLRPSITVDKEHLDKKEIFFKNDASVYIKTSTIETCIGDPLSFSYFEIKIEDSFTETFEIRRTTLQKHEHFHIHQHEHDDDDDHQNDTFPEELHSHSHGLNVTDPKNHKHKHEHEHDFRYIIMNDHKFNDDPNTSPDKVHSNTANHLTETKTHPVLVGKKHVVDSALMYAGNPIVDLNNKRFGYLGFNNSDPDLTEASYRFFENRDNGVDKIEIWKMTSSDFSIQPEDYWGYIDRSFSDAVMVEFNWKLVKWDLEDLFDDDKDTERQSNIDSPLFSRSHAPEDRLNRARYSINKTSDSIVILDTLDVVIFDEDTNAESIQENKMLFAVTKDGTQTLINTFIDETMRLTSFTLLPNEVLTVKEFSNNSDYLGSAVTYTDITNHLEQTLNPISDSIRLITYYDNTLGESFGLSIQDESSQKWNANYFSSALTKRFNNDLENTTWGSILDQRPTSDTYEFSPILLQSETAVTPDPNSSNTALFEPRVYLLDTKSLVWKDKLLGTVPTTVSIAHSAIMHNELFAQITIQETLASPQILKTYYFNPDDPTTEMLLMYEEVFNE